MAKQASVSEVRAWAKQNGLELGDRGRLPAEVWAAWDARNSRASVLKPRVSQNGTSPQVTALHRAEKRIKRLEEQVSELTARLGRLEQRSVQPGKLFARKR